MPAKRIEEKKTLDIASKENRREENRTLPAKRIEEKKTEVVCSVLVEDTFVRFV